MSPEGVESAILIRIGLSPARPPAKVCARGGTRTQKPFGYPSKFVPWERFELSWVFTHRVLSPARLPVPPPRQKLFLLYKFKSKEQQFLLLFFLQKKYKNYLNKKSLYSYNCSGKRGDQFYRYCHYYSYN